MPTTLHSKKQKLYKTKSNKIPPPSKKNRLSLGWRQWLSSGCNQISLTCPSGLWVSYPETKMKNSTLLEDFVPCLHNLRKEGLHNENLPRLENIILRPGADDSHGFAEATIHLLSGQHLDHCSSPTLGPRRHAFTKIQRGTLLQPIDSYFFSCCKEKCRQGVQWEPMSVTWTPS